MVLDQDTLQQMVNEQIRICLVMCLLGSFSYWIASSRGFFRSLYYSSEPHVRGYEVCLAFGLFIFSQLFLFPTLGTLGYYLLTGESLLSGRLTHLQAGWLTIFTILGGFLSNLLALAFISKQRRGPLFQQNNASLWQQLKVGCLSWFICFPLVTALGRLVSLGVLLWFRQEAVDQSAVKHLKALFDYPLVFSLTTLEIVLLVPFAEEFLFRGLLQTWLKNRFKNILGAIIATSTLFAFFHFSWSQGITNIELLTSLFVLSCYLGYLRESQQSLWAPIGLHAFFNLVSILMIISFDT